MVEDFTEDDQSLFRFTVGFPNSPTEGLSDGVGFDSGWVFNGMVLGDQSFQFPVDELSTDSFRSPIVQEYKPIDVWRVYLFVDTGYGITEMLVD